MKIKKYQFGGTTGGNNGTSALTGNVAFSLTPAQIFNS